MFKGLKVEASKSSSRVSLRPYLDMGLIFKNLEGLLVIYREGGGETYRLDDEIGLPLITLYNQPNFEWLTELINPSKAKVLSRFDFKQVTLFNYIQTCKGLFQLFECSPVLAWLYVIRAPLSDSHLTFYLMRKKRREILSHISGIKCQEKHVKFINKIDIFLGSEEESIYILNSLKDESIVDLFRHQDSIRPSELYLIDQYPFLKGSKLLKSLGDRDYAYFAELRVGTTELFKIYDDTIQLGVTLGLKNSRDIVANCESEAKLRELHDYWVERLNISNKKLKKDVYFPRFKYSSSENFEHINSVNSLIDEGREMSHCVATYKERIFSGKSILFKVLKPERATLELGKNKNGFFVKQLKLKSNQEPSEDCKKATRIWLDSVNKDFKIDEGSKLSTEDALSINIALN